jgi:aspartyl-tRNA(Asn)/glutamyl-tRNA(Gln) amidotransferase subunit A
LLAPVSPILPFAVGEKVKDPVAMYLADVFTIPVSLAGMPSIALPVGSSGNLPIGMQLIGNHFQEVRVLQAAHAVEQALSLPSLGLDTLC